MNIRSILCILLFFLGILWYFMSPLCEDIYVFLGSAHLAEIQYGGGISGAIESWELKLLANRILIYLFYKLTTFFVSFDEKESFEFTFKLIYLFLVLSAAASLSFASIRKAKEWIFGMNFLELFCILSFALLFTSLHNHLQAEYSAMLICLIGIPFLISDSKWINTIGILLLATTPFFKGITLLFACEVFLLLLIFLQVPLKRLLFLTISWGVACLVATIALIYFYPREIMDLNDATLFQQSFSSLGLEHQFEMGIKYSFYNFVFFPIWGTSILGFFVLLANKTVSRDHMIKLVLLWLLGFLGVFIQHRFYVYHYLFLFLPAAATLIIFANHSWFRLQNSFQLLFKIAIGVSVFSFILFNGPLQKTIPPNIQKATFFPDYLFDWSYESMETVITKYRLTTEKAKQIIPKEIETVLYLDEGTGVWCLGKKSASRYYFPIPVQRSNRNPQLMKSHCYGLNLHEVLSFEGKYIHLDRSWFKMETIPGLDSLKRKLEGYQEEKISDAVSIFVKRP